MDTSVAAVTVSVVEPVIPLEVAEMVVEPTFKALARPAEVMVAVVVLDEAQVTLPVKFCVLESE